GLLDSGRDAGDAWFEHMFFAIYGSPAVQAIAGVGAASGRRLRRAGKSRLHSELLQARIAELKSRIPAGGLQEAVVRSLLYVGMGRGSGDGRGLRNGRGVPAR